MTSPSPDDAVRVTLHPGEDVLLRPGARLRDLRAPLAALTRRPEVRYAPLVVDGERLADHHVAGERPLLPGAVVAVEGPGAALGVERLGTALGVERPGAVLGVERAGGVFRTGAVRPGRTGAVGPGRTGAVRADRTGAVGPGRTGAVGPGRTGAVRPGRTGAVGPGRTGAVRPGRTGAVGPGRTGAVGPGRWAGRAGRAGRVGAGSGGPGVGRVPGLGSPWLVARVTGYDAGTVVGAEGPWAALRTWARMRPGGRVAVRRSGGPAAWLAPRPEPAHGGVPWAYSLLPVVTSLGLAAALRQPLLAVFALVGLVVALPQLRSARQRASGAPVVRQRPLPGPAGLLAYAHAALHVSPGAWTAARDAWATSPSSAAPRAGVFRVPPGPGAHLVTAPDDDPWERLLHDGAVAVLGPDGAARAVARALVARLAVRGAQVLVQGGAPGWAWVRWLPSDGPLVLVHDGEPRPPTTDSACRALGPRQAPGTGQVPGTDQAPGSPVSRASRFAADGGAGLVKAGSPWPSTLVVSVGVVPAGCRAVVRVLDSRRVRITGPDGTARVVPLVGVTAGWSEHLARLLAGAARLGRTAAGQREHAGLPDAVALTAAHGLTEVPGPDALAARWADAHGWAVPLGTAADGTTVRLDLVGDGPHLLVAGTTGSGKSELLQTLVLGLALTRSPADLALLLVDFKGGASLGTCPRLPHVVGQVTDLDPGLAARALAGLRAELRRRERALATHGVPDVAALPRGALPRLVVVIDEFRALADDLPEFLPALLRTAAQGRSLGVHLVLATQRPGGAVGPDLRANVSARLALRVTDALESRDVLDDPAAARIPASTPGRAVLRLGSAPPVPLQCAHAGTPDPAEVPLVRRAPTTSHRPAAARRLATPPAVTDTPGPGARRTSGRGTTNPPGTVPASTLPAGTVPTGAGDLDTATLVVEAAREAARTLGHVPGRPPWLPPLPRRATTADLPPGTRRDRRGLVLALGDDPEHQRRTTVTWDPADGHLAVLGRARSGRTTALVTVALAALGKGWAVHGVTRDPAGFAALHHLPGFRGTLDPDDATALARLLHDATPTTMPGVHPAPGPEPLPAPDHPTLVLVDGAEDVRATLPAAALRSGLVFAVSADGPAVGGLAARVGPRLVLLGTDRAADVVLGAPPSLAGTGGPPGRAVWCGRSEPVPCQVLDPWPGQVLEPRLSRAPESQPGQVLEQRSNRVREPPLSPRSRSPTSPRRRTAS